MGQFSMTISAVAGSVLSDNQQEGSSEAYFLASRFLSGARRLGDENSRVLLGWMEINGFGGSLGNVYNGIREIELSRLYGAENAEEYLGKLGDIEISYTYSEGCQITYENYNILTAWNWVRGDVTPRGKGALDLNYYLCENSTNGQLWVTSYLGRSVSEPTYFFETDIDNCSMIFNIAREGDQYRAKTTYDATCHKFVPDVQAPRNISRNPLDYFYGDGTVGSGGFSSPTGTSSGNRCVSISGQCIGLDCIIDEMSITGGPGQIDNSWSTPMVCSDYSGASDGIYSYVMKTNFDNVCSGSFQISAQARAGVTVGIYESCDLSNVSEY
jgi:hypothetical protein